MPVLLKAGFGQRRVVACRCLPLQGRAWITKEHRLKPVLLKADAVHNVALSYNFPLGKPELITNLLTCVLPRQCSVGSDNPTHLTVTVNVGAATGP